VNRINTVNVQIPAVEDKPIAVGVEVVEIGFGAGVCISRQKYSCNDRIVQIGNINGFNIVSVTATYIVIVTAGINYQIVVDGKVAVNPMAFRKLSDQNALFRLICIANINARSTIVSLVIISDDAVVDVETVDVSAGSINIFYNRMRNIAQVCDTQMIAAVLVIVKIVNDFSGVSAYAI